MLRLCYCYSYSVYRNLNSQPLDRTIDLCHCRMRHRPNSLPHRLGRVPIMVRCNLWNVFRCYSYRYIQCHLTNRCHNESIECKWREFCKMKFPYGHSECNENKRETTINIDIRRVLITKTLLLCVYV